MNNSNTNISIENNNNNVVVAASGNCSSLPTTATTSSNTNDDGDGDDGDEIITVGRLVEVASRTWPGINKEGGVARVIDVHYNNDGNTDTSVNKIQHPTHVTVQYMVRRSKEKRVPVQYVKLAPQYEDHRSSQMISSTSLTTTTLTTHNSRSIFIKKIIT